MNKSLLKKWIIALLGVALLAGCTNDPAPATPSSSAEPALGTSAPADASATPGGAQGPVLTEPGTYPISNETIQMSALATPNANIMDISTNYVTQWFEELTNVHVTWETIASSDAATKINLMISSGEALPDIMIGGSIVADKIAQYSYGSQGVYQPLEDLIRDNAPGLAGMMEQEPQLVSQMTAPDGHIYSIGNYEYTFHSIYYVKAWINQTWLDALNLQKPTTTEELYDVLMAFKTDDPNGNNQADEVPMSAIAKGYQTKIEGWLMNSFVYDDVNQRINLTDDKVWVPYTTDQWREGMRYFNRLYQDGLLDPECFTQDATQIKQLVDGEDVRLGLGMGSSATSFADGSSDGWHNYTILEPVIGPEGNRWTAYYPPSMGTGRFVITRDCQIPEVAIRWLDVFYDTDRSLTIWFGEEGVDWKFADEGDIGLDGQPAYWEEVNILRTMTQQNKGCLHLGPRYGVRDIVSGRAQPGGGDPWYHETHMYNAAKLYESLNITPDQVLPPLFFTIEAADEYSELKTTIDSYVDECFARFVIGDLKIDTDWDSYLSELSSMGLERYIQLHQEAYDATIE